MTNLAAYQQAYDSWMDAKEKVDGDLDRLLSTPWVSIDEKEDRVRRFDELQARRSEAYQQFLAHGRQASHIIARGRRLPKVSTPHPSKRSSA